MTESQNERMTEGHGKSSIAPTFSKRGYNNVLSIHWLYRRSRYSVIKTLGFDVIGTSHTT